MKKLLCLFLISTSLLFCLAGCNIVPNMIGKTVENSIESTEGTTEKGSIHNTIEEPQIPNASEESSMYDISSYDGIIAMFKDIVNHFPSYTEEKMRSGECDGIDEIEGQETKELYQKLFISGYRFYLDEYAYKYQEDGRNYFGYAVTDINQNGSAELILLTDLYDVIAVFSMKEKHPTLILDNYDYIQYWRINEQGRFYSQHFSDDSLYTRIYSLTESDDLEMDEEYLCTNYNYLFREECYNITNGKRTSLSKPEWIDLTHGWIHRYEAGIITKNNTEFDFIRLFGKLNLYLPTFYTWDWVSSQFNPNENVLFISQLSDNTVSLSLYDTIYPKYVYKASVNATFNGNIATFETEEISGRVEFGLDSVWLIIEKTNVSGVPCGAFIYTKLSYSCG